MQTGNAEIVERASTPTSPSSPKPLRDAILASVLGIGLGIALALFLDVLDRRVKNLEDFERIYGLQTLAGIPQRSFRKLFPAERSAEFEPFRILRDSIFFAGFEREIRTVLVTSAVPGEGKTSVATNLARAVALSGRSVILVEADLRRPTFAARFGFDRRVAGLTSALVGRLPVRDVLQAPEADVASSLRVLPSGPVPPNPSEMLQSRRMGEVLQELGDEADLVIIDGPPLLPVADARILLDRGDIDAAIVVARAFQTRRDEARRARLVIGQHRLAPLGLAVTGLPGGPRTSTTARPRSPASTSRTTRGPSCRAVGGPERPDVAARLVPGALRTPVIPRLVGNGDVGRSPALWPLLGLVLAGGALVSFLAAGRLVDSILLVLIAAVAAGVAVVLLAHRGGAARGLRQRRGPDRVEGSRIPLDLGAASTIRCSSRSLALEAIFFLLIVGDGDRPRGPRAVPRPGASRSRPRTRRGGTRVRGGHGTLRRRRPWGYRRSGQALRAAGDPPLRGRQPRSHAGRHPSRGTLFAGLAILKGGLGLGAYALGRGPTLDAGGSVITYYEPLANFVLMLFSIGVIVAILARVHVPVWIWAAWIICNASLVLSFRRSFWIAALLGVAVAVLFGIGRLGRVVAVR